MIRRHLTTTRLALLAGGLFIAAIAASQVAFSFKLAYPAAFAAVLLAAVGAGLIIWGGRTAGARVATRLGADPEQGRQVGAVLGMAAVVAAALARTMA
jgi:ABC-type Fe3+-siderophore transport system permease subunit